MFSVLQEILKWSADRPMWQRDALRRLIIDDELTDEDIVELIEVCKSEYGLAKKKDPLPLAAEHIPEGREAGSPVSIESICHHKGVNALAENQTLNFNSGLTIVYGDNGAGKTGYIRILKQACRARGREDILGNLTSGVVPPKPEVTIKYKIGHETDARKWNGGDTDEFISRVSIFDTQCAAVYLNDKTDVAFLPFGLDLFDKLVRTCRTIRRRLESEQNELRTNSIPLIASQIHQGTVAAQLISNINSLTNPEDVKAITRLSPQETERLNFLEKSLQDLQANDPIKLIAQLEQLSRRIRSLAEHLRIQEASLSAEKVLSVFTARKDGRAKSEEAKRLREKTFPDGMLPGTGGDQWKAMWESSRIFSEQQAYPSEKFPFTSDGAKCVLCQHDIGHAEEHRLKQFEEFVISTTEQELRKIRKDFAQKRDAFVSLKTMTNDIEETIKELNLEHKDKAETISASIAQNEKRRTYVVAALEENKDLPSDCPDLALAFGHVQSVATEIDARIKSLRSTKAEEAKKKLIAEVQELRARVQLAKHEQIILNEIENKKKFAAYGQCIDETRANAITQKSSDVTKSIVSDRLKKSFKEELQKLEFKHVEVELKEHGGTDGVFYHKLILTRNPGIEVPRVVSEGEQRCISIASFFAELSTANDPSAIIFDDPVSSLDYQWRNAVARRLVEESKSRQVIVFTHDIVFLLALKRFSEESNIQQVDQHVRRQESSAGVCATELPWVAMKVKDKISYLKNQQVIAENLSKEGNQDAYEYKAKYLYGLLREAWERAVEEVLLNCTVERFGPSIQTKRLEKLSDITNEDYKLVEKGMTKCSECLPGHDQAPAARAPIPGASELKQDIEALDTWVKTIRARRN